MGRINKERELPSGLQFDGKNYTIDKWVMRKRLHKRLGPVSRKEAEEALAEGITDIKRGKHVSSSAGSLTVNDLLRYYYEHHLKHVVSGKDAKWHIPTISRLMGNQRVMDLKKSDIETFKRVRGSEKTKSKTGTGHPISPRTIQAELQLLTMAIKYAIGDRLIPSNPVDGLCGVEVPRKKKIVLDHGEYNGEEWEKLYKAIPDHWKLFVLTCYETGMRPSEVINLKSDWIKSVNGGYIIEVPADQEKTGFNDRRIPISKRLEVELLNKEDPLFEHADYFKMIRQSVKKAGLRGEITLYALRRTRATIWDAIDSGAARVALGHVPADVHEESYVEITNDRLMRLVGIELDNKLKLFKQA